MSERILRAMDLVLQTGDLSPEGLVLGGVALTRLDLMKAQAGLATGLVSFRADILSRLDRLVEKHPDVFQDLINFQEKYQEAYNGPPRELPDEYAWREDFLTEEMIEYSEARKAGDLEKQFDALIDLSYVAVGTAYLQGFNFTAGWKEVHRSNMTKDYVKKKGKSIVKGPTYSPPNLKPILWPNLS
jgi:predicted HAD superfamily Cof-like phosphohydrolase